MSQSLVKNLVHLVFSTKHRMPVLTDDVRPPLHGYLAGILANWESPALLVNSVADHVHILFALSKNQPLKRVVEEIKKSSSKWIKTQGPAFAEFHWQAGYGAFSVSRSAVPTVLQYIERQREHHERLTFQDEFRALCRRYEVDLDERYAWD